VKWKDRNQALRLKREAESFSIFYDFPKMEPFRKNQALFLMKEARLVDNQKVTMNIHGKTIIYWEGI
jgi:hypothetical protein